MRTELANQSLRGTLFKPHRCQLELVRCSFNQNMLTARRYLVAPDPLLWTWDNHLSLYRLVTVDLSVLGLVTVDLLVHGLVTVNLSVTKLNLYCRLYEQVLLRQYVEKQNVTAKNNIIYSNVFVNLSYSLSVSLYVSIYIYIYWDNSFTLF